MCSSGLVGFDLLHFTYDEALRLLLPFSVPFINSSIFQSRSSLGDRFEHARDTLSRGQGIERARNAHHTKVRGQTNVAETIRLKRPVTNESTRCVMGNTERDPVCGMQIDTQDAAATSEHQGQTYYFCSEGCKEKFEQNPQQYAGGQEQSAGNFG